MKAIEDKKDGVETDETRRDRTIARERKKARKIINAVLMTPTQIFRISVLEDSSVIFLADLSN